VRVVVFGAGATGSLFGALLARAGHDVTLVGRAAHVQAIEKNGLAVEGAAPAVVRLPAVTELANGTSVDAVLLTVKSYDLERAVTAVRISVNPPTVAAPMQNGLDMANRATDGFRRAGWAERDVRVVRVIHSVPATWLGPGRVRQAGTGDILLSRTEQSGPGRLGPLFESTELPVRYVESMDREEWRKAIVNAAINPVTADHGVTNGQLAEDPWRGQALKLLHEALEVARAEGFDFPDDEIERDLFKVVRATAENRSSMLQDLDRGRPTEVEAISGAILVAGRRHGFRLPQTERIVQRLRDRAPPPAAQPL
jgi:2-dehydropantoate 2-reductase